MIAVVQIAVAGGGRLCGRILYARWISNVENGWRNPSYASLRRLAAALDLAVAELVSRAEQIERDGITDRKRTVTASQR